MKEWQYIICILQCIYNCIKHGNFLRIKLYLVDTWISCQVGILLGNSVFQSFIEQDLLYVKQIATVWIYQPHTNTRQLSCHALTFTFWLLLSVLSLLLILPYSVWHVTWSQFLFHGCKVYSLWSHGVNRTNCDFLMEHVGINA